MLDRRLAAAGQQASYGWVILALGVAVHVVDAMLRQGFAGLAPFYQQDLGITRAEVGLLSSAMSVGGVILLLPAGRLSDRWSLRTVLPAGLALTALAVLLVARAQTFALVAALLFVTGFGHAWVSPSTSRAIAYWFSARARGTAMSIKQTGNPLGGILAASLLPAVAAASGWRSAVVVLAVATGLVAAAVALFARERPLAHASVSPVANPGLGELLRDPGLWAASVVAAALGAAQVVTTTYLTLYVKEAHDRDAVAAASFLAWAFAGGALGRIGWGFASDRLCGGARGPVLGCIGAIVALCSLAFGLARGPWPTAALVPVAVLLGASAIGWNGVFLTVLAELAGPRAVGTVTAVGLLITNVGLVSGPPLFGLAVDLSGSYQPAWMGMAALNALAAGVAFTWMRGAARRW